MQELLYQDLQVGDLVLIDWPRTRWDHRRGILHELRQVPDEGNLGLVLLDGATIRVPIKRIIKISVIGERL